MKKLLKNRMLVGGLSIALAVVILLVVQPFIIGKINEQAEVFRAKKGLAQGEVLTKEKVEKVTVGKYNLPSSVLTKEEDLLGKYTAGKIYAGDYFTEEKLSDHPVFGDEYLYDLGEGKMAISVSLSSLAAGLSGKLEQNDIVRIFSVKETAHSPESLLYVKTLAVTTGEGTDKEDVSGEREKKEKLPKTITLLVDERQAKDLVYLEAKEQVHVALVFRGEEALRKKYLAEQEEILMRIKEEEKSKEVGEELGNELGTSTEGKGEQQ